MTLPEHICDSGDCGLDPCEAKPVHFKAGEAPLHCEACGKKTPQLRAAEALADAVEAMVQQRVIDARSPAADALLDYRDPTAVTQLTEKEYHAALARLETIFDAKPGTPAGKEFDLLTLLISRYEDEHHPIAPPDPAEAERFRMEQMASEARCILSEWLSCFGAQAHTRLWKLVELFEVAHDYPAATPEELEPPWAEVDPGIMDVVKLLHDNGIRMNCSCQGGEGHLFDAPTVIVYDRTLAAIRALTAAGYRIAAVEPDDYDMTVITLDPHG